MLYSGPPCTHLQGDLLGLLSVPQALHRYCIDGWSDYCAVPPVSLDLADFERVHHAAHVDEIFNALEHPPQSLRVAEQAAYAVESCASHYSASLAALDGRFALAPAGDFGQAGYGSAAPPCLLNGLLVTAARLREEGRVRSVLIVDGNGLASAGTEAVIEQLGLTCVEYLSLAGDRMGNDFDVACERAEAVISRFAGNLVLYQCGTDCCSSLAANSYMNQLQWEERHRQFARLSRAGGVPWVLSIGAAFSRSDACVLMERALRHFRQEDVLPEAPSSTGRP